MNEKRTLHPAPEQITEAEDMAGKTLNVGDRVYAPPHSFGGEDDGMFDSPLIKDDGEEHLTPSVRGRITEFYWAPIKGMWFCRIQSKEGFDNFKLPGRCKRQAGRTSSEKQDKRIADRQQTIELAKKPKPVVERRRVKRGR